ncbi:peptide ABC transporter substrate-binding protein [Sporosarcina limicola]|uniref:Oligopeptide transport system substrate-binding protein n=1 Tax=Sporosarcina limicola TaxID=34101 RepID=A0A927MEQ6_9BACL|nr:peptide ABC transporter substrate-binding protein [Sporosarcina limicola]MBE1553283.1 oligopeptide transport system substrate-binding protein [Sporosarcina limicola]
MMKNKKWLGFMFLAIFTLVLSGCNFSSSNKKEDEPKKEDNGKEGGEKVDQVLNLSEPSDIPTLDSTKAHDAIAFNVLNNVNEGLYRQNQDNDSVLALAEKHEMSDDEMVHTFTLKDTKWSNGDPVTAADFEYAWKRVMKDNGAYNYMIVTAGVKNAEAIMNGEMDAEELGIKATGDKTLEVTLESPNPLFKTLLAFATFLPQNQKFVEKLGDQYALEADNILANGPFKLVNWTQEQGWEMVKNEDYWDAENVKLEKVNVFVVKDPSSGINLYETGKIDRVKLTSALVDQYKEKEDFKNVKAAGTVFLRFNHNNPALKNVNLRKAVNMAIDREGLTDVILKDGSSPIYGVVAESFYFSPDKVDYRELNGDFNKGTPAEAKEYWEKALAEIGQKEVKVSLNIADTDEMKKVAEFLQAQLEDNLPGFKLEIKAVPFKQRLEIEKAIKYDLSLSTWGPDYRDPMTYLDMWVKGSSANRMDYYNPKLDALVTEARGETDLSKRYKLLLNIEKIFLEDDVAVAPLYQRGSSVLLNNKVKGLVDHPTGADTSYQWAYIEE